MIVLVVCAVLTYSKGQAEEKENLLKGTKEEKKTELQSAKERQEELKEEAAYRQTKQYIEDLAREKLGLVKPDEIIIREEEK